MQIQFCPVCAGENIEVTGVDHDGNATAGCLDCWAFFTLYNQEYDPIEHDEAGNTHSG